jgi:hypothetical protein
MEYAVVGCGGVAGEKQVLRFTQEDNFFGVAEGKNRPEAGAFSEN